MKLEYNIITTNERKYVMKPINARVSFTTDDLSIEELDKIIHGLRKIRERKNAAKLLNAKLNDLLEEAANNGLAVYGSEDCMSGKLKEFFVVEE